MLSRLLVAVVVAALMPVALAVSPATADGHEDCPPGTTPVSVGSGVICVVVTDPGGPGDSGDPGDPGGGGHDQQPAGCYKTDGTEVPCVTQDGTWWSGHQCYAAPYDAPPWSPPWQGNTDGSLWQCTSCESAGPSTTCHVEIIWTAPGEEPGPPTPDELAQTAVGLMPLAEARVHTAPQAPAPTYVGVENWLWIPEAQWTVLSKSVTAGGTTVRVTATPSQVIWSMGPDAVTCYTPGTAWTRGMTDAAKTSCSFTYEETSADQPDGVFAVSAVIRYQITWTCTGTCPTASGDLGLVDAPAGAGQLRVLQRQTVVVQ